MKTANKYNPYCVPGSDPYVVFKKYYSIYSSQQLYEIGASIGFILQVRKPGHACMKYLAWDELADGDVRLGSGSLASDTGLTTTLYYFSG